MNLEASTFRKGLPESRARRRAISVFPTPVGPIMRMFFGVTSAATSGGQALPADAVAQRDRHRALGRGLAHHVAVELGHDLARREGVAAGGRGRLGQVDGH